MLRYLTQRIVCTVMGHLPGTVRCSTNDDGSFLVGTWCNRCLDVFDVRTEPQVPFGVPLSTRFTSTTPTTQAETR